MRIEALISAADAAGYAMVSEEDFSGPDEAANAAGETENSKALALMAPAGADSTSWSYVQSHATQAWNWIAGRFVNGAPA